MQATNIALTALFNKTLSKSMSYDEYVTLTANLTAQHKSTGNTPNDEDLANYTMLNDRRLKRWNKTLKLDQEIIDIAANQAKNLVWLVLSESWCGDAAHNIPVLNKIAMLNDKIDLRIAIRNDNLDLMNEFLTNGAAAIPKLIAYDKDTKKIAYEWGPRPTEATVLVADYKALHGELTLEFKEDLQRWYNKNKGQAVINDFKKLLV